MNKEQIKSIILTVLVILNFALNSKIWSNKKLWPSGYNFFVSAGNSAFARKFFSFFGYDNTDYTSKTNITTPKQIIINTGDQTTRLALDYDHDMFSDINSRSYDILSSAFSADSRSISSVTQDEWYSVLMSKSIYLHYTAEYGTAMMTQFFAVKESALSSFTAYISDVVIAFDNTSNVAVYVHNNRNNTYYKIVTSIEKDETEMLIDTLCNDFDNEDISNIINYSFDLLFDRGEQKALLAPMISIYNNPQTYKIIASENPTLKSDNSFNTYVIDNLLNLFDIKPTAMRRYTEANGTVVFVENDAILKLSPNGILEFSASGTNTGIKLSDSGSNYTDICLAADFMDMINNEISANRNLYLASDLTEEYINNSTVNLNFDYTVSGLPVDLSISGTEHAVSMVISDGYLQKYTQILRSYSVASDISQTKTFIEALDETVKHYSNTANQIYVDKMYAAYMDDGTLGEKNADWKIILDNVRD